MFYRIFVTSCNRDVYAFDYEANKPVVVASQSCMVGCTACATICPEDALEFLSQGDVRQIIRKNKIITQAKSTLCANPEKYDVKKRAPVGA